MLAFFQSLGVLGYIIVGIAVLGLWNLKRLVFLRSPLDSQQHKSWRATGGTARPDHLEDTSRKQGK